jgi:ubiquinone/menaquinone biosynthesis C-methylase UbiE
MKSNDIIHQARTRFDQELHTDTYRKIHSDHAHLQSLMNLLDIQPANRYLDLGTGSGYLAFEMAKRFPLTHITGIDIAAQSIAQNNNICREKHIPNLNFIAYEGLQLPFENAYFHGIISRYALHHFPDIEASLSEFNRITAENGYIIISDPVTLPDDTVNFIDQFQSLKPDGHVHFYRKKELKALFAQYGFTIETEFNSTVTYPRDLTPAYTSLIQQTPPAILEQYNVSIQENQVYVTVQVMNVLYRKTNQA